MEDDIRDNALRELQAIALTHRAVLAYLVMVARMVGDEGTRAALAGTEQMLSRSLERMFAQWPADFRAGGMAMAQVELDAILTAPILTASGEEPS